MKESAKSGRRIVPISNLPEDRGGAPDSDRDFTIQRLRREVSRLKAELKRYADADRFKTSKLLKQRNLWRLGFDYGEWPTMGEALRNLQEIESGIIYEGRIAKDELQSEESELERRKE